jgi:hypothetical protein
MKTQTTTKPITHIQKQRLEGEMIKDYVMEHLDLSVLEYNTLVYDFGIEFLQQLNVVYYIEIAYNKSFWKWWRAEWHIWQQDLMNFLFENDYELTLELFRSEMNVLSHEELTNRSFENYLKLFKNV